MPMLSHVRSKRGPGIAWTPTDGSNEVVAGPPRGAVARTPQLCLTQAAILEIDAHLRESTSPVPFGLLLGELCVCPQENLVYLLSDRVARSRSELSESDPCGQLAAELRSLVAQQEKHGKMAIGWYLGGMGDDPTVDSDVTSVHRQIFPEPWKVLLLRGEVDGITHGAIVRFDGSSGASYRVPFFELLPEREARKTGERRTAIRWKEYHTLGPSPGPGESEALERRADVASPSRWGTKDLHASSEAFRRGLRSLPREKASTPPAAEFLGARATAAQPPDTPQAHASAPLADESDVRTHVRSPARDLDESHAEHARQLPTSIGAGRDRRAPGHDLQHIFVDGTLVPVRWTHNSNRKTRRLATIRRVAITPLLTVLLVLIAVAALSRLAR